jgi:hypothetical protein
VPTVAPATPHFDPESITSSSVIVTITESIYQEKRYVEEENPNNFVLVSSVDPEKKETINKEVKEKDTEEKYVIIDDKEPGKDDSLPEKPQEALR